MIDELKRNIDTEIGMLRELSTYVNRVDFARGEEKRLLLQTVESLIRSVKMLNDSVPKILQNISAVKKLPPKNADTGLHKVSFQKTDYNVEVAISSKNREKFLQELSISENLIRKLKRKDSKDDEEEIEEFKAARGYLKLSNKLFLGKASQLVEKGYFKQLSAELRKANINILFESYVAMILLTSFISIFVGMGIVLFLLFFNVTATFPFVELFEGSYLIRLVQTFWIIFAAPLATFGALYIYPSTEKSSISKRIDSELPFAVVHMSAISGSGIEPSEIFRIIGMSNEYIYLRRELRKILNQINIYGYDLVTAISNVSRTTPSVRLSELLSGISTTIHSGGNLQTFFEKRAESLLVNYRLEREKFTKIAETFMDIYISVVVAAPMILMIMMIMISLSGLGFNLSPLQLSVVIIAIISLINVLFLVFLHVKQPSY